MKSTALQFTGLLVFSFAVLFISPFCGMDFISPFALSSHPLQKSILISLRIPRVIAAFIAGSGLSLCGMMFQAMFKNPLADPFTLGISSGASCGAAATILLGLNGAFLSITFISMGAFSGAALAMLCVFLLSSFQRTTSSITTLLAGIAISFLFSSLLMFMQYLSSLRDSFHIVRWLMGGIEVFGYDQILSMLPFYCIGMILIVIKLPILDQLLAGDDLAQTRGVEIIHSKSLFLLAATLIVGSIVAVCGPIGFVGLMIPHISKMIFKTKHLILGPACFLSGGIFLVICDTISRIIIAPAEMPVGVITALLGGPFFLWLLFFRRSKGFSFDYR